MNSLTGRFASFIAWALFFLFLSLLPLLLSGIGLDGNGRYQIGVLNDIGLYALLGLSLNLILGNAGLFNMGHGAFYALGAYTTAILNTRYAVPIMYTLPLAGSVAGFFAFLASMPILRLRGDYLLVVTIGIVEIVRIALTNDVGGITGGANGIAGIARPELLGWRIVSPEQFFYLIWGFVALTVVLFSALNNSRFGRALNYIKQDELAAEGNGINTYRYKLMVFVLGAFWAGMAGTLYAAKMKFISPVAFSFSESVLMFAIVILGGAGSIPGVILGAFILIGLPELFRELADARMMFFGLAMVLMMIFRPQGFLPARSRRYKASLVQGGAQYAESARGASGHEGQAQKACGQTDAGGKEL